MTDATRYTANGNMIVACEWCGREMATSQIQGHENICVHNPDVAEGVKACLHACADGPFMCARTEYDKARTEYENLPSSGTLLVSLGLPLWDDLAAWAGLLPATERIPYTLAEIRRLSESNHDGIVGPSSEEWRTYRTPGTLLAESLNNRFGGWAGVLAAAGLHQESRSYYINHSKKRARGGDAAVEEYVKTQREKAIEALESTFDFRAIPAIDRGVKPVYNWRTKRHEDMHVLELR